MATEKNRLTDDEVCKRFGITRDHPRFDIARGLADNRPNRVICEVPEVQCVHCGHEFIANLEFLRTKVSFWCFTCGRLIYIEHLDSPNINGSDSPICVTFNTHNPKGTDE